MNNYHDLLDRYAYRPIERLRAYADLSGELADLLKTHAVAFLALATDYGPLAKRSAAVRALHQGARLPAVCTLLGIPYALRRVPPEACRTALPWTEWSMGDASALSNFIPLGHARLDCWMEAVFFCGAACSSGFALWIARQHRLFEGPPLEARLLLPVALYAWHSFRPDAPLHSLLPNLWSPKMGVRRTINETRRWLTYVAARLHLPDPVVIDPWLRPATVGEYELIPLLSHRDLLDEHLAMRHCVDRYGARVARGQCRLFSLRQHGRRVATFEVVQDGRNRCIVNQIKGPRNRSVANDVREMVEQWVSTTPPWPRPVWIQKSCAIEAVLADLMTPYRADRAHVLRWIEPVRLSLIRSALSTLALRAGVTS